MSVVVRASVMKVRLGGADPDVLDVDQPEPVFPYPDQTSAKSGYNKFFSRSTLSSCFCVVFLGSSSLVALCLHVSVSFF